MNILITGGACAGKTTSIKFIKDYLIERNYNVCIKEEIPTKLINNGMEPRGMDFIKVIIKNQIMQLQEVNSDAINIFDGSPLDNIKFINQDELENILNTYDTNIKKILENYDYIIHLESVAVSMSAKYSNENNKARTLNVVESANREKKLLEIYDEFPRRYIVYAFENFDDKIKAIIKIIQEIVKDI